jgi:hypothetical protein
MGGKSTQFQASRQGNFDQRRGDFHGITQSEIDHQSGWGDDDPGGCDQRSP